MPTGIFIRTEKHREAAKGAGLKIGLALKGQKWPDERRLSYVPWNKGKRWHTEEWKKELSQKMMGNQYGKGIIPSQETRLKLSCALKGKVPKNLSVIQKDPIIQKKRFEKIKNNLIPYRFPKGFIPWNKGKYLGGKIITENILFYVSGEWRKTTKIIKLRDRKCFICEKAGGRLNAHHINPISNLDKRLDLLNLILLCASCHKRIHLNKLSLLPQAIEAAVQRLKAQ